MMMQSMTKRLIVWAVVTALILMIPLVKMQFSDEVNWALFDFTLMGALVFGAGLTFELIARKGATAPYKLAVGLALAAIFFLVWINIAVGVIGEGLST